MEEEGRRPGVSEREREREREGIWMKFLYLASTARFFY
jgi:hypothetical protein